MVYSVDASPRGGSGLGARGARAATTLRQRPRRRRRRGAAAHPQRPARGRGRRASCSWRMRSSRRARCAGCSPARGRSTPTIWTCPNGPPPATLDLAGLEARVNAGRDRAERSCTTRSRPQLNDTGHRPPTRCAALILRCDGFGLAAAVPAGASGDDDAARDALRRQLSLLPRRRQGAPRRGERAGGAAPGAGRRAGQHVRMRRHLAERLEDTFGAGFVALPAFTCGHADELATALADSTARARPAIRSPSPPGSSAGKRVREPVARLRRALAGAEVMGTGERPDARASRNCRMKRERALGRAAAHRGQADPARGASRS